MGTAGVAVGDGGGVGVGVVRSGAGVGSGARYVHALAVALGKDGLAVTGPTVAVETGPTGGVAAGAAVAQAPTARATNPRMMGVRRGKVLPTLR
jgi:hypothetical protein